ncbi:hypothetical protein CYMTET_32367 [Cymbomonas tetramitiformis]|uniref:Uncharacterized protein n=1 Tax=Cymbomonas tetramitiformis TaxID=36881 RepID=A0AAE0KRX4_9CHLO|nr:hypothetical protein CYMTET_32367 [Cymbomonas tetramitiformis]
MENATPVASDRPVPVPPLPAVQTPKTLQQKFQLARQLETEIQNRTQDWRKALGADETNSLIFKHFKDRVLQIHGQQFEFSYFLGKLQTNKGITSYVSHIFRHITRLSTVVATEGVERISVEDPEVEPIIGKLTSNFKNSVSSEHVFNIITFLFTYDCYISILEVTAAEVTQIENSVGNTAQSQNPAPIPVSPAFSLQDLEIGDEEHHEEEWEHIDDEGGYGTANLTGNYVSTLVGHEESGDFDLTAIQRAQKHSEHFNKTTEQLEGHEGDYSNEDFIQTVKILRMEKSDRRKFTVREISEINRQITSLLERLHLDISHLSIKGQNRNDDSVEDPKAPPFISVKVKSESEARAVLEKAVYVIDNSRYIAAPKSNRLVRFNIEFVAAAANLQVSTVRIVEYLSGTVFSEFISRVVYVQSFSETTKESSRFIRRFFAILRPPLGPAPEPTTPDPDNKEHSLYFLPLQYIFEPMGIIYLTQCSAWECRRCHPANKKYGHCSKTCPEITQFKGKGKGKGRGKGNSNSAASVHYGSRGAGSARWEQNRARAEKRKSEPASHSPAHKQASGFGRKEEIAAAAKSGGADISDRFH